MQRVHISPALGSRRVADVSTEDVEALARSMLARGLAPKTVRNVITFLHGASPWRSRGWCVTNPVTRAARPRRRRSGDARSRPAVPHGPRARGGRSRPSRRGRAPRPAPTPRPSRPAPPPPPTFSVRAARPDPRGGRHGLAAVRAARASAGETSTSRAHRVRVRNAFVRGEHSARASRTSAPDARCRWRTGLRASSRPGELAHRSTTTTTSSSHIPSCGKPLDRTKVTPAVQGGVPRGGRPGDPLPRPPAHVRHFARRLRRAAASDPGVPRPRGPEDNADLRPLRAGGVGGRHGQLCVPAWTERRTVTSTAVPRARR